MVSNNIDYAEFAQKLYAGCIFSDAWIDGKERFSTSAVVLSKHEIEKLYESASAIARLYDELTDIVWAHEELLDEYFHLTEFQKLMWLASGGKWHGIGRLDLFFLEDGSVRACEMNSDTPSGEPETVLLNSMLAEHFPGLTDPNVNFENAFLNTLVRYHQLETGRDMSLRGMNVGIVYPSELPEDLSMIRLYSNWLGNRGASVVLGSPFNLKYKRSKKQLTLMGVPVDAVIRHYKTDWWSERISVWEDCDFADSEPLTEYLLDTLTAIEERAASVFNPFGAVISQNKLTLSFFFDHIDLFSEKSKETIYKYLPEAHALSRFVPDAGIREDWVLKSDYGCEGDEVVIGRNASEEIWQKTLELAKHEHWIVQRYFESVRIDGFEPNFGIYVLGGIPNGVFTRLAPKSTDYHSICLPTYVK